MPGKTDALSAAEIRRRLARTRMPEDPLAVDWTGARERLSEKELQAMQGDLRAAAVLIPIIERNSDLTVLLTERSAELRHHAGQISFPGGGMEAGDLSIANTALREAHEEVGIRPAQVEIAGFLDPTPTVTGFAVTSVIGIVEDSISVSIDEQEVADAFEVPLPFLLDARNAVRSERQFRGLSFPVTTFHFEGRQIWGATAAIIETLRRTIYSK